MALMGFREPNQVRWVGIRPGHRGTQILLDIDVGNNTQILIDGTQVTITYLTSWFMGLVRDGAYSGAMEITENDDTHVCWLGYIDTLALQIGRHITQDLTFPIEMPVGYKLKVVAAGAGSQVYGYVHGWEE